MYLLLRKTSTDDKKTPKHYICIKGSNKLYLLHISYISYKYVEISNRDINVSVFALVIHDGSW